MKRLTPKERKLVENKAKGMKHSKAYKDAYDVSPTTKDSTAITNTHKIINKPHVKQALEIALKKHDITIDRALLPIEKGLDAKKQNQFTGEITDDMNIQLKASDRALKLLGYSDNSSQTAFINVINLDKERYKI